MRHSVVLDPKKCLGCTTCVKTCPTEAIRVRRGKATILPNRCIDCGRCIRSCPHKAVRSMCDSLSLLKKYEYTVAVPDPSLYGQFQNLDDVNIVLNGLLELGFDDVFEAAAAAEMLSEAARDRGKTDRPRPEISSACPAVVRLICIRFPRLISHLSPAISPVELAAALAREKAAKMTGLPPERIGVFSIVPCSSLVTAAHAPLGLPRPVLDGAFAVRDLYLALLDPMRELDPAKLRPLSHTGEMGVRWGYVGGEAKARRSGRDVAVDGIDAVISTLEDIEDDRLPEAEFVELRACVQGCVGGCFTVANPFGSRMRLKKLSETLPAALNSPGMAEREILAQAQAPEFSPALQLDPDRRQAMVKLLKIQDLEQTLPGLSCGSCGAPSCHAFAEDVVLGRAAVDDCIFQVRERMMEGGSDPDEYLPAPFRGRGSAAHAPQPVSDR